VSFEQTIKTILAFDIGLKRIGVASGQNLTQTTNAAGQITVVHGKIDWAQLDKHIHQWQPNLIVIGDPNTSDPHLRKVINRFKHHIQQHYKLPIVDIDERLTSDAANAELSNIQLNQTRKTALRDQVAACLILETYFNTA